MRKNKGIFGKVVVLAVIVLNVFFSIAVLAIFLKTSCEPTGLIASWFSFTTIELWSLAGIKKAKEKRKDDDGY